VLCPPLVPPSSLVRRVRAHQRPRTKDRRRRYAEVETALTRGRVRGLGVVRWARNQWLATIHVDCCELTVRYFKRGCAAIFDVGRLHAGIDFEYFSPKPHLNTARRRHRVCHDDSACLLFGKNLVDLVAKGMRLLRLSSVPACT